MPLSSRFKERMARDFNGGIKMWFMIQPKAKIGSNVQLNFNSSAEIKEWSKRYNTSINEIRQIFPIRAIPFSKTLEILRQKKQQA